jgi:hypothetical protein
MNFSRPLNSTDLRFDSHFEGGNLMKAMRVYQPSAGAKMLLRVMPLVRLARYRPLLCRARPHICVSVFLALDSDTSTEYELALAPDISSKQHIQWYSVLRECIPHGAPSHRSTCSAFLHCALLVLFLFATCTANGVQSASYPLPCFDSGFIFQCPTCELA